MSLDRRAAGILLHPTSLPGRFGIGDFGPAAERFLDWAEAAGQSFWQVLPLGPPAYGGSPYGCLSAFAGNPLLISLERLVDDGLLESAELSDVPRFPTRQVDYGRVAEWKEPLLRRSFERFDDPAALQSFVDHPEQAFWLDDWALYSAIKRRHGGAPWSEWDTALARRESGALAVARAELAREIEFHRYVQFQFHRQWRALRAIADRRGVQILGDLPFYVAGDSAEVWAWPKLFDLDADGQPRNVAGVPPDYFAADGQLWGNPLYRWTKMAGDGYRWWIERLAANLRLADVVRIDHFRAFCDYWSVPANAETAREGHWVDGPGMDFFRAVGAELGELPLVAEDLGDIHEGVIALRRDAGLPGMRILQFGFGSADDHHAPHNFESHAVVYTGTHDNDTAVGWYRSLDRASRRRFRDYTGASGRGVHWSLVRLAYTSVAELAMVPMQDVLGLGGEARMNTPGLDRGNWLWRMTMDELERADGERLRRLAEVSGRV